MEKDEEKQKEMWNTYHVEHVLPHLAKIEAALEKNGGLLVGKSITWADLAYYAFFSNLAMKFPDGLKDAPRLRALMDRIEQIPSIKKYLATRPVTEN